MSFGGFRFHFHRVAASVTLAWAFCMQPASAGASPSAAEVLNRTLASDPWGLSGATISAHALLRDKQGGGSDLAFDAQSKRLDATLSESVVRFSGPPDLAGAAFLQIQKREGDDDRFLYLPELKRSRRISGSLRGNSFMGTDFTFADLDRRDLREGTPTIRGEETISRWDCYMLDVVPRRADSQYSHLLLWVRKDNFLPIRIRMFDRAGGLAKVFTAIEVKRVSGEWFVSKSRMSNEQTGHVTELTLARIVIGDPIRDDVFTVRSLEQE